MKKFWEIIAFIAVGIAAFALVITCLGCFHFATEAHSGFHTVCGVITLIAGGYGVYKASKWSMEPFMHDENKGNTD